MLDIQTTARLVQEARQGQETARQALFFRYAPMANGLALRLIGRDADVDDLVQEAFLHAFARLHTLKEPEVFGTWLASVLVRTANKLLRRRRLAEALGLRRRLPVDVDALLGNTAPADVAVQVRAVYAAIEDLPPSLRIPFLLRRVEGMELAEIASVTGKSLATIKRRIAEVDVRLANAPMRQGRDR